MEKNRNRNKDKNDSKVNAVKPGIRLQVFLSRNGVCSRRRAMDVVQDGRVKVNGAVITEPSTPVDPKKDFIVVDGKRIEEKAYVYILLNKPAGYVTTKNDRFAEKTVFDLLPQQYQYLSPVGRLDKDTEGLLILTNDGDFAYKLTHPKFNVEKLYYLRVEGRLSIEKISKLEKGIYIDARRTAASKIRKLRETNNSTELTMVIHEGRKRQIRRMFERMGHDVVYLKRVVQGPFSLGELKIGEWRMIDQPTLLNRERNSEFRKGGSTSAKRERENFREKQG